MLCRCMGPGRFYLLINDDVIVGPTALQEMLDFADAHPEAGLGGKLIRPDCTLDWPSKRSFQTRSVFLSGPATGQAVPKQQAIRERAGKK